MSVQEEINSFRQEFRECEKNYGERIVALEMTTLEKLTRLETQMGAVSTRLTTFVSQHQFAPVRLIAYGLAGGVLMTVLGAVLAKSLGL